MRQKVLQHRIYQGAVSPLRTPQDAPRRAHSTFTKDSSIGKTPLSHRIVAPRLWGKRSLHQNGFSLLEVVLTVAIVLILSVGGFLVHKGFTDNARQAAVNSAANQVLTAAVASISISGKTPYTAVRDYNRTSHEIRANITAANHEAMTVTAIDQVGTSGEATTSGNFSQISTTSFNDPGVTYEWLGEPGASQSVKKVDGKVVATNYAPGIEAWSNPGNEEIFSPRHAAVTQNRRFEFKVNIPEGATVAKHRYEVRAFEPAPHREDGQAAFHNGFYGTSRVSGRAIAFNPDGEWHKVSATTTLNPESDVFTMFFLGSSRYAYKYEIRNVQVVFDDEQFTDFFDGDA